MPAKNQDDAAFIDATIDAIAGEAPVAFMNQAQAAAAAGRLARTVAVQSPKVVRRGLGLASELTRVATGRSTVAPAKGDRRFSDETWTRNPVYKRWAQSYLAWNESVHGVIDDVDLDPKSKLRSRFLTSLVTEAVAPTNTLIGNPEAIREAVRTRGKSLVDGVRHAAYDLRHNSGMPSMVDTRPFIPGETVAATPGSVVFRNDVLEILQYKPTTARVNEIPLLIVPPQINKYYVLDLAPGRSLMEYAVSKGQRVFAVSWRNPTPDQRSWNLDTYAAALDEALAAVLQITRQPAANLLGTCAGGMTSAALLGHYSANGDHRVNSITFLVTLLDWTVPSTVGTFTSGPAMNAASQRTRAKGVLSGRDLETLFALLRPNDLVWNYYVNNYLLGKNPPAFDVLAWNVDSTNLTAALYDDFLKIAAGNLLARPGELEVLGSKIDLSAITADAYVVAGLTDHLTPWEACYETTNMLGGSTEFVACASGHIQTLVCPPDNPKARYLTNPDTPTTAEEWKAGATQHAGSWWDHWLPWLAARSGRKVKAPSTLGSQLFPERGPAPGTYVLG